MRISAFYFSGTGNTEFAINYLKDKFFAHDIIFSIYNIEDNDTDYTNIISYADAVLIAYPVYSSEPPRIVNAFIDKYENVFLDKDILIIATQSIASGDGAMYLGRRLKKLGAHILIAEHINMPNNISDVGFLKIRNGSENDRKVVRAINRLGRIAENFAEGQKFIRGNFAGRIFGIFQRLLFKPFKKKLYSGLKINLSQCGFCLNCVKTCPTKNILADAERVCTLDKCTLCYRCVNNCPHKAISLFSKYKPKKQYKGIKHNP